MKSVPTFMIALLVFGFLFLVLPEKGYSGLVPLPPDVSCCINTEGSCVNLDEGIVACQIGTIVSGGTCDVEGPGGICSAIPETANVPTLSEWGLITMAGILGFIGFMVIRRRKATA